MLMVPEKWRRLPQPIGGAVALHFLLFLILEGQLASGNPLFDVLCMAS
jgi:hypothetical protein